MADEQEDKKAQEAENAPQKEGKSKKKSDEKTSDGNILQWIITAVVIIACAGAGLGLGRLFAGSNPTEISETAEPSQKELTSFEDLKADDSEAETWYYDLDPVVANLDVPGVTRYVRASLTLEINSEVDVEKGVAFLEEKKPLLTNWLTIYLANLTLEDATGAKNLRRIQLQVLDGFNEKLFPDAKPQINKILFKEFAIQ